MAKSGTKRLLRTFIPWCITGVALYIVLKGMDWEQFQSNLRNAKLLPILAAFMMTGLSYILRARRWQHLFPRPVLSYFNALQVLILGFFMNNVLPARTGELVRAHLGARVTGVSRTLVLATVAGERLADGLALSIFFVIFSLHLGDQGYSENLFWVACMFGAAAFSVLALLLFRDPVFRLVDHLAERWDSKFSEYITTRARAFVEGLSPMCHWPGSFVIALWSAIIWSIELFVYYSVATAFGQPMSFSLCVLFMVTVNFSSLIPAAPGGIGVIEAATTAVLVSVGIDREIALTMVLTQHVIQYLVIGVPGALAMITWRRSIREVEESNDKELATAV